jgi:ABC-type transport system involved in cytochrome bd biosynthesis fused ATPase/permease subunit
VRATLTTALFWVRFHFWLTILWLLQFPFVLFFEPSLKKSVTYLIIISIAAAALGQFSSWQAARVEWKLEQHEKEGKIDN